MRRKRVSSPQEKLLAVFVSIFLLTVVGSVFLLKSSVYSSEQDLVQQAPSTFGKARLIEECKRPLFMALERKTANAGPLEPLTLHHYGKCDLGKEKSLKSFSLGDAQLGRFLGDLNNDGYAEVGLTPVQNSHFLHIYSGKNGNLMGQIDAGGDIYRFFDLGDVTGDSVSDIGFGDPWTQFVRVHSGSDFSLVEEIQDVAIQSGEFFGYYAHSLGDLTGNGINELGITAPYYDGAVSDVGRFFIYSYNAGTSSYNRIHLIEGVAQSKKLGLAGIGNLEDFNQDGNPEFYVIGDDIARVYSYQGGSVNLLNEMAIDSYHNNEDPAIVLDYNGDGSNELLIGQSTAINGGLVEMFDSSFATLLWSKLPPKILASDRSAEQFGKGLLVVPDITADGIPEILITAPNTNQVYSYNSWTSPSEIKYNSGVIYLFDVALDETILRIPGDAVDQGLGYDIAVVE